MNQPHKLTDFGAIVFKNEERQKARELIRPFVYIDCKQPTCNAVLGNGAVRLASIGLRPLLMIAHANQTGYIQQDIFKMEKFPDSNEYDHYTHWKYNFWYTAEGNIIILNLQFWDYDIKPARRKGSGYENIWQAKVGLGYGKEAF